MDNKELRREAISKSAMGLVVGLSFILAGFWAGRQLHVVWDVWPSTDGEVVHAAVQKAVEVPYAKGGLPVSIFSPRIEFEYTVRGTLYKTEVPSVSAADSYEQAAANLARTFAPGSHHLLRYNPHDPREIQMGAAPFGPLAFAFLLLAGGVALLMFGFQSLRVAFRTPREAAVATAGGTVLPFTGRAKETGAPAALLCPSCNSPVSASDHVCRNCLKSLRAA